MVIYSGFSHWKWWFFHSYVSLPEGMENEKYGYIVTIWLFNIAMENHGKSQFLIGKPSISMGHLYHGYVK